LNVGKSSETSILSPQLPFIINYCPTLFKFQGKNLIYHRNTGTIE